VGNDRLPQIAKTFHPDPVVVTGAAIGLVSAFLDFLVFKPNRLAAGAGLTLWDATNPLWAAAIIALWLICLVMGIAGPAHWQSRTAGLAASLVLVANFVLAGISAGDLASATPLARVSPGAGLWLTLLGGYIVLFGTRRQLKSFPVWKWALSAAAPAVLVAFLFGGWLNGLSIVQEYLGREDRFSQELARHIALFGGSVFVGALLGIPLGILSARSGRAEKPITFIANISQTIPSLVLFGLLIAPLAALSGAFPALREFGIHGVGAAPAVIALTLYSLLPLVRNTYVGLRQVDPAITDAGLGMGMSRGQVFRKLEFPLAIPLIMTGIRTAAVQGVGNTAVAALIGAGGLGQFIFQGLGQAAPDLILLGALPIIALALLVDSVMGAAVTLVTSKGTVRAGK